MACASRITSERRVRGEGSGRQRWPGYMIEKCPEPAVC